METYDGGDTIHGLRKAKGVRSEMVRYDLLVCSNGNNAASIGDANEDVAAYDGIDVLASRADERTNDTNDASADNEPLLSQSVSKRAEYWTAGQSQKKAAICDPACLLGTTNGDHLELDDGVGCIRHGCTTIGQRQSKHSKDGPHANGVLQGCFIVMSSKLSLADRSQFMVLYMSGLRVLLRIHSG